jgi:hypothetical protein
MNDAPDTPAANEQVTLRELRRRLMARGGQVSLRTLARWCSRGVRLRGRRYRLVQDQVA